MDNFEMLYNFCGEFDEMLKKEYKKFKLKENGVTFPQFCVCKFSNIMNEAKEVLNIKKN